MDTTERCGSLLRALPAKGGGSANSEEAKKKSGRWILPVGAPLGVEDIAYEETEELDAAGGVA